MSGEVKIKPGRRLVNEAVTEAKVNEVFSGMVATVRPGSVGARELADGAVTAAKLSDAVQQEISLPDGSIDTDKLADGCLSADAAGRAKMANDYVTADQLAALAVTAGKIANGAVTAANMAAGIDLQSLQNEQADTDGAASADVTTTWTEVMSVAITPSSIASKVLVLLSAVIHAEGPPKQTTPYNEAVAGYKITRKIGAGAEADLVVGDAAGSRVRVTAAVKSNVSSGLSAASVSGGPAGFAHVDSPGTVSAVTYKLYIIDREAWRNVNLNATSEPTHTTVDFRQGRSNLVVVELM